RAGVVEAEERRITAAADGARGPRSERDFHDVARRELGPADLGAAVLARLLDGEGRAAVATVDPGADDLGEIALGGNLFVELFFGARCDHDLARVVHELRDTPVGPHHDRA